MRPEAETCSTFSQRRPQRSMTAPPGTQGVTYKVGSIHDSIFYRMSAVEGKLQNLLLFFAPLRHKLFLRKYTNRDEGTTSRPTRTPQKLKELKTPEA